MIRILESWEEAAQLLGEPLPPEVQLFSFDVFDTLLLRRLDPDLILSGVGHWLDQALQAKGHVADVPADSLAAFHRAYHQLAQANVVRGLDSEVFGQDLFPTWVAQAAPGLEAAAAARLAQELEEVYFRYETWACYPNPALAPALERLAQAGKPLIYVSDMYLPARFVAGLLEQAGLLRFFKAGYVSSETSLLKRTGRLFPWVFQQEGCSPEQVLHLGDNRLADAEQPHLAGMQGICVEEPEHQARRAVMKFDEQQLHHNPAWLGLAAYQAAMGQGLRRFRSPEEAYGFEVLGPVFASFMHGVAEQGRHEGLDLVLFPAREGLLLKELYQLIAPVVYGAAPAPKAVYFYGSRLSTIFYGSPFGLYSLSCTQVNGPLVLPSLLSPLGFSDAELAAIAQDNGFFDLQVPLPGHYLFYAPFLNLLEDRRIQVRAAELFERDRTLMQAYLSEIGFFQAQRVGFVDVGWGGQIQNNLYRGIRGQAQAPELVGLYLALNHSGHERNCPGNRFSALLADHCELDWASLAAFQFPQLFEAAVRSPHGTVVGYEVDEASRVRPVFKSEDNPSRQAEAADDLQIAHYQTGILDYMTQYAMVMQVAGGSWQQTRGFAVEMIERMIRYPHAAEVSHLFQLNNVSDLGSELVLRLGGQPQPAGMFQVKQVKQQLQGSFWRHGTLALVAPKWMRWAFSLAFDALRLVPPRQHSACPGVPWPPGSQPLPRHWDHQPSSLEQNRLVQNRNLLDQELEAGFCRLRQELASRPTASTHQPLPPVAFGFWQHLEAKLIYRLARLVGRLKQRHPLVRRGLGLKPLVRRAILGSPNLGPRAKRLLGLLFR